MAAEVGQLELAHEYLAEAALMDLRDVERNTRDGMHMASLAGAWIALVGGFGGMRHIQDTLSFSPRLPNGISRMTFHMRFRGRLLRCTVTRHEATYELVAGEPMVLMHHGDQQRLEEEPIRLKIPAIHAARAPISPRAASPSPAGNSAAIVPTRRLRGNPDDS